ncbi:MAG: hypothetical protein EPN72_05690 [Nevskiaceae bacterium]|nr:MAG: hypothetical protein EPN63_03505 [Nevskiaceae bacterium]TBR73627.1 MAG: hypothetical protein EPN72_05690 [Nevskiaceae bacterium]
MNDARLALHGLAIKKHGTAASVAEITGLDAATVQQALDAAAQNGRVARTGEAFMLQPAAQVALKMSYAPDYAAQRADTAMQATYDAFEIINRQLKTLMTDWQTLTLAGEQVPNDHSDPGYDEKIIVRLGDLHERAEGILDRFAAGLPRLALYKKLLARALEKAEDGDVAWVSDVRCMSYHTTWFELHEDLIRVLGRTREA